MRTRPSLRTCSRAVIACSATTRSSSPAPTNTARRSSAPPPRPASRRSSLRIRSRRSSSALWDRMGLTYDDYIRTTEPRHAARRAEALHARSTNAATSTSTPTPARTASRDEAFVDAPAGTPCPDCGRLLETVTEENFFFKLSAFQQPLIELIESDTLAITPETPQKRSAQLPARGPQRPFDLALQLHLGRSGSGASRLRSRSRSTLSTYGSTRSQTT